MSSVAKDLPEGMTVLDAGRAGVVCEVLICGWAAPTCITATSVFAEQQLTIPDHHKVASITSIFLGCRHRRLLCWRMKSEKGGELESDVDERPKGIIYTVPNKGCPRRNE
jgi:hypothetical protein